MNKIRVFWFRRDLRLEDNAGLFNALAGKSSVLPIFIFDDNIIDELPEEDARISFIYSNLKDIDEKLKTFGSGLKIYKGKPEKVWEQILEDYDVEAVYANEDYEPYAIKRDAEIDNFLKSNGVSKGLQTHKDSVVFAKDEVLKDNGSPYTVFTPYKNKWLALFQETDIRDKKLTEKDYNGFLKFKNDFPSLESLGFRPSPIRVKPYILDGLNSYADTRDFPAIDGTSYLSPHLRFGTVSVRQIINSLDKKDETFLSELIWREFFMQILYHFPRVESENFKTKYNGIKWRNEEGEFQKWCYGETGFPIVDAGMRQLNKTGYMHNRVRMITAGFLCKHLLIDWRWGEAYFAKKLLDYELSSNNGNWQWAAGTGCDAAPYFRIFNPITQLKKFDPKLEYTRKWIDNFDLGYNVPPVVEHRFARERALEAYKRGLRG
ncbi:MAG: deoxyribodipyrimidine photolyase [Marinilabiliales bacterium]|nr:MAG: deoxyribodipyrimidine photolyase [Marinilabiliales bacterium]